MNSSSSELQKNENKFDSYEKRIELVNKYNYEFVSDYGFYDPLICGSIDGTDNKSHDRAIDRALTNDYKPNFKAKLTDPEKTLFVGRINYKTSEEKLNEIFSKYGKIKSLRLIRDLVTGFSKGYAFVEYKHRSDAKYAYKKSYSLMVDNRELIVEFEYERKLHGWKPRRLGGGLGGYKQSGQLRFGGRYKPFGKIFKSIHKK